MGLGAHSVELCELHKCEDPANPAFLLKSIFHNRFHSTLTLNIGTPNNTLHARIRPHTLLLVYGSAHCSPFACPTTVAFGTFKGQGALKNVFLAVLVPSQRTLLDGQLPSYRSVSDASHILPHKSLAGTRAHGVFSLTLTYSQTGSYSYF